MPSPAMRLADKQERTPTQVDPAAKAYPPVSEGRDAAASRSGAAGRAMRVERKEAYVCVKTGGVRTGWNTPAEQGVGKMDLR